MVPYLSICPFKPGSMVGVRPNLLDWRLLG